MAQPPTRRRSLYELLEVDSSATAAEIRKAYRRLAMKRHPDRGGNEQLFNQISDAYSILSDADKRAEYDRDPINQPNFNDPFGFPNQGGGGFDWNSLFRPPMQPTNPKKTGTAPMIHPLSIDLANFYHGLTKRLRITRDVLCHQCFGGCRSRCAACEDKSPTYLCLCGENAQRRDCRHCHGSGVRLVTRPMGPGMVQQVQQHCPCDENGQCDACQGKGVEQEKQIVTITIVPGMRPGQRILLDSHTAIMDNLHRRGTEALAALRAGCMLPAALTLLITSYMTPSQQPATQAGQDIVVVLMAKEEAEVEEKAPNSLPLSSKLGPLQRYGKYGVDLVQDVTISLADALCGTTLHLPHFRGSYHGPLPPASPRSYSAGEGPALPDLETKCSPSSSSPSSSSPSSSPSSSSPSSSSPSSSSPSSSSPSSSSPSSSSPSSSSPSSSSLSSPASSPLCPPPSPHSTSSATTSSTSTTASSSSTSFSASSNASSSSSPSPSLPLATIPIVIPPLSAWSDSFVVPGLGMPIWYSPEDLSPPVKPAPIARDQAEYEDPNAEGGWACPECTYVHPHTRVVECEMCGTLNPGGRMQRPAPPPPPKVEKKAPPPPAPKKVGVSEEKSTRSYGDLYVALMVEFPARNHLLTGEQKTQLRQTLSHLSAEGTSASETRTASTGTTIPIVSADLLPSITVENSGAAPCVAETMLSFQKKYTPLKLKFPTEISNDEVVAEAYDEAARNKDIENRLKERLNLNNPQIDVEGWQNYMQDDSWRAWVRQAREPSFRHEDDQHPGDQQGCRAQ